MNVIYIPYDDLLGPGVIHAYQFASEIARGGDRVLFLLPGQMKTLDTMERRPDFEVAKVLYDGPTLAIPLAQRVMAFRPDIVHAWTPRNVPARVALEVKARTGARIIVHYEDEEDVIYDKEFPKSSLFRLRYALKILFPPRPGEPYPNLWTWKHPLLTPLVNRFASAFTALAPAIRDRLRASRRQKTHLLYPGVDLERFNPRVPPAPLRERFGVPGAILVIYAGSVGPSHDFDILLEAIATAAKADPRVCLIQLGRFAGTEEAVRARISGLGIGRHVVLAGMTDHKEMPSCLAAGDLLVHPARDNDFNRYRLPSKIPEYLAMGKPCVIAQAGIGAEFRDRVEVLKTYTDSPAELAERILELVRDDALRASLGRNARAAAERMFSLETNAKRLREIYEETMRAYARGKGELHQ